MENKMRLRFLGTGTSAGVPVMGCKCRVCQSTDAKDKRFRTAALLEVDGVRLLIDSGPDIRMQLMPLPFKPIDGVLITHIHYDHVAGIDDLRGHCVFGDLNIYADSNTARGLRQTMPYCFTDKLYPGVPLIALHEIAPHEPFSIKGVKITPFQVMHGKLPILGYRIGKLSYITDMKSIEDEELEYLQGTEVLVVNALRWEREHHSHQLVEDAIRFSRYVGAKRTYLVHLTHNIGLHNEANRLLPEGVEFAFDGLEIDI